MFTSCATSNNLPKTVEPHPTIVPITSQTCPQHVPTASLQTCYRPQKRPNIISNIPASKLVVKVNCWISSHVCSRAFFFYHVAMLGLWSPPQKLKTRTRTTSASCTCTCIHTHTHIDMYTYTCGHKQVIRNALKVIHV